jgi:protein-S-isoprenylcysteine O-methyltransferase Ste14
LSALELKVPPLALTAIALVPVLAAGQWFQAAEFPFPGHRAISIVALAFGVAILLGAALQFRLKHTTLDPRVPAKASEFVAKGLYRFSRNPMYLGMALVLFGVAAWRSNAVSYLLVGAFCIYLTEFQIKPEERALDGLFGDEYAAYRLLVRRWI